MMVEQSCGGGTSLELMSSYTSRRQRDRERNTGDSRNLEISNCTPSDTSLTRLRLLILPKQFYQLGTRYLNTWTTTVGKWRPSTPEHRSYSWAEKASSLGHDKMCFQAAAVGSGIRLQKVVPRSAVCTGSSSHSTLHMMRLCRHW